MEIPGLIVLMDLFGLICIILLVGCPGVVKLIEGVRGKDGFPWVDPVLSV